VAAGAGLPRTDHSPGAKPRLGVITGAGDEMLRWVLVAGSTAAIQQVRKGRGNPSPWLLEPVRRKPPKLAAVALANKTARILWKLMVSGERYNGAEDRARARRGASLNGGCAPRRSLNTITATMEA